MKTVKFSLFSMTVLMLAVSLSIPSFAADKIKLTFATTMPPKSTIEIAAKRFADAIGEKTAGRIAITHYGTGTLANAPDLIQGVDKNTINMGILHFAIVGRRSGALEFIGSLGALGCWDSYEHYFRFVDHPKVREIAAKEFEKFFNAKLLAAPSFGIGTWVRRDKPIERLEDFKGYKTRTAGAAMGALYKALGAVGIEMSAKELYTALQRGTIDGCSTGLSRVRRSRLYEVAPYVTIDVTIPILSHWFVINMKEWNKLSPEDQALFQAEAKEMDIWARDYVKKEIEDDLNTLRKSAKVVMELKPEERKRIIEVAKPVMADLSKKNLGEYYDELWGILDNTR